MQEVPTPHNRLMVSGGGDRAGKTPENSAVSAAPTVGAGKAGRAWAWWGERLVEAGGGCSRGVLIPWHLQLLALGSRGFQVCEIALGRGAVTGHTGARSVQCPWVVRPRGQRWGPSNISLISILRGSAFIHIHKWQQHFLGLEGETTPYLPPNTGAKCLILAFMSSTSGH